MRKLAICLLTATLATSAAAAPSAGAAEREPPAPATANPLAGDGMWIWYVSKAAGGDPAAIAAKARRRGIETVLIKSGDGSDSWSQFTPRLVARLHAAGLRVCAWHYVYGEAPVGEARVSAAAAELGADCLVIDAESEYEGRYAQASAYIGELRRLVGPDYPVGLAAFPYVGYHPSFPYSVFLAPGAAQFNLPQMYWRAIGVRVSEVFATTYSYNSVYQAPIYPLGQLYENPPGREVRRFRRLALAYGADGVSWWSWQHAAGRGWRAAAKRIGAAIVARHEPYPELEQGASGDLVIWAQQHLAAGRWYRGPISGRYASSTTTAITRLQGSSGLAVTGVLDDATWRWLLEAYEPVAVDWSERGAGRAATNGEPRSATLEPRANELRRARSGAG